MAAHLDLYRPGDSPLQHQDSRAKLLLAGAAILVLALLPDGAWPAYFLMLALVWSAAILSEVGVGYVAVRGLAALVFLLAALPALWSTPGSALLAITPAIEITAPGLERFGSLALRAWLSVQVAVLLTATTPFPDLLGAMSAVGVPDMLVSILSLMWRYLFLLVEDAARLLRARSSRSGVDGTARRSGGGLGWRAKVAGGLAGNLFVRSLDRSDRVYAAMLARGFTGRPVQKERPPLPAGERRALICGMLALAGLLAAAHLFWR